MTPIGYISKAFAKVSSGWKVKLACQMGDLALKGAKDHSPEEQEKLWRRVNRLLKLGADVNALSTQDSTSRTVFARMILGGYDIVVSRMLDAGADPNMRACPASSVTPFHLGARMRSPDMMRAMIAKGADVHAASEDGNNALYHMFTYVDEPVTDAERKKTADCYDFLTKECGLALQPKTMERLFNETPYLAFVEPKLEAAQALWSATIHRNHDTMRALLSSGTPPDSARDYGHYTALHYAITGDDKDAIRMLMMAQANLALAEQSIGNIAPQTMEFIKSVAAERDEKLSNVSAGQKINVGRPLKFKTPGANA